MTVEDFSDLIDEAREQGVVMLVCVTPEGCVGKMPVAPDVMPYLWRAEPLPVMRDGLRAAYEADGRELPAWLAEDASA